MVIPLFGAVGDVQPVIVADSVGPPPPTRSKLRTSPNSIRGDCPFVAASTDNVLDHDGVDPPAGAAHWAVPLTSIDVKTWPIVPAVFVSLKAVSDWMVFAAVSLPETSTVPSAPVSREISPRVPEAVPVSMVTPPESPPLALPVLITNSPESPDVIELPVFIRTSPESPAALEEPVEKNNAPVFAAVGVLILIKPDPDEVMSCPLTTRFPPRKGVASSTTAVR